MSSEWTMVIITGIYVIATIAICVANFWSASASKKQLVEIKKQYDETDRPIIEVEFLYINKAFFGLRFVNHGKHTAQNVRIKISEKFFDSIDSLGMTDYVRMQKDKKCVIGVGQHYDLLFGSYEQYKELKNKTPAIGTVLYEYNNHSYKDDFCIDFENYMTIFSTNTYEDDLLKAFNKTNQHLEGLKKQVELLQQNHNIKKDN